MTDDYTIGNEGARVLTKRNAAVNQLPTLSNKKNQEPVRDETRYYHEMVAMFDDILINDEIIENKWITVTPNEKEDSDIFTFNKATGGGGIIKLDETHLTSDIAITYDGHVLDTMTIIDFMPNPLETMWKTIDLAANEVTMTNSYTDSLYVSPQKAKDLAGCTLGWRNTPNLRTANRVSTFTNNKPAA